MLLGTEDGDRLELSVDGYQFPDAADPRQRYSWHQVAGRATRGSESWAFRWPALTCDESVGLGRWLADLAGTFPDAHPGRVEFTEPDLAFTFEPGRPPTLVVELDLELAAPARRANRAGRPDVLRLGTSAAQLGTAAADWAADLERWPGGLPEP